MQCGKEIKADFYEIHISNCGKTKIKKGVTEVFKCPNCQIKLPLEEQSRHQEVCNTEKKSNPNEFDYHEYMQDMDEDEALARALQESEENF